MSRKVLPVNLSLQNVVCTSLFMCSYMLYVIYKISCIFMQNPVQPKVYSLFFQVHQF